MNFGVNLYNWFLTNAQSLVLMAIVVINGWFQCETGRFYACMVESNGMKSSR